jgi:hypothetical protein
MKWPGYNEVDGWIWSHANHRAVRQVHASPYQAKADGYEMPRSGETQGQKPQASEAHATAERGWELELAQEGSESQPWSRHMTKWYLLSSR